MKYLPTRDFETVTSALNFDTPECHVIGGCDLYTTKAAGSDKKLYKNIENSLESQHQSLLQLSASLSPPQAESLAESLNLSRSSPFGPLSQISSRRTFAYLIATLNASHPDYDFSHILRPSDFRKERSLRTVMALIDSTLHNLRPKPSTGYLAVPSAWTSAGMPAGVRTPGGSEIWGLRMWTLIDQEMSLRECDLYCYAPEEDPFDGDEGSIWSMNYFFFNKNRKRVCYLYLRGLSVMSHSPMNTFLKTPASKRKSSRIGAFEGISEGARKRAKYWLGDKANADDLEGGWGDEDDDVISEPGDDEVDAEESFDIREREYTSPAYYLSDDDADDDDYDGQDDDDYADEINMRKQRQKGAVRAMSEQIADSMEV